MLELRQVSTGYGAVRVVWDVTIRVETGELVAIVGANGAGKTTLMRAISGLLPLHGGEILLAGQPLHRMEAHSIVQAGVAHVPEGRRLFPHATVLDNLLLGAHIVKSAVRRRELVAQSLSYFPELQGREGQVAGTLSGGEQQMLAIARGLMCQPKLVLLDEPSLGLAPMLVRRVFEIVQELHRSGITILLVEQNVEHSLRVADRAYVLENGRIRIEGTGADLLDSAYTKQAFLGL